MSILLWCFIPLRFTLEFNKFNLLGKISKCKNYHMLTLFNLLGKNELLALRLRYDVTPDDSGFNIKNKINNVFKQACGL